MQKSVFSFHYVDSGDKTQVVRLGNRFTFPSILIIQESNLDEVLSKVVHVCSPASKEAEARKIAANLRSGIPSTFWARYSCVTRLCSKNKNKEFGWRRLGEQPR